MAVANGFTTTFDLTGNPAHRTVRAWSHDAQQYGVSWRTRARQYAKAYGEAKAIRADGSVVQWYCFDGVVRQRTYQHAYCRE